MIRSYLIIINQLRTKQKTKGAYASSMRDACKD